MADPVSPNASRVAGLEVEELIDLGEDIVIAGFDPAEIDALLLADDETDEKILERGGSERRRIAADAVAFRPPPV